MESLDISFYEALIYIRFIIIIIIGDETRSYEKIKNNK